MAGDCVANPDGWAIGEQAREVWRGAFKFNEPGIAAKLIEVRVAAAGLLEFEAARKWNAFRVHMSLGFKVSKY